MTAAYRRAVQSLWEGRAAVTVREGVPDPATGRTEMAERVLAEDLPCRISRKTTQAAEPEEEAARTAQAATLYIDPAMEIPAGSKITVTQNGMTADYGRSGKAAAYSCHQEIPLALWKEWA